MAYSPLYPIDYTPTGDSTSMAIYKHIQELLALYGHVNRLDDSDNAIESRVNTLETDVVDGSKILTHLKTVDGSGSGLDADLLDGQHASYYVKVSDYSDTDVLDKLKNVDTNTSGLNANYLQGHAASYFSVSTHTHNYVVRPSSSSLPVGCITFAKMVGAKPSFISKEGSVSGSSLRIFAYTDAPSSGGILTGTWKNITGIILLSGDVGFFVRTA